MFSKGLDASAKIAKYEPNRTVRDASAAPEALSDCLRTESGDLSTCATS